MSIGDERGEVRFFPAREIDADRPIVSIVGAGVAGLTAAHELAERGFDVHVYEIERDPLRRPNLQYTTETAEDRSRTATRETPHVGGLAATQWCRLPDRAFFYLKPTTTTTEVRRALLVRDFVFADLGDWPEQLSPDERELKHWEGRWPLIPFGVGASWVSEAWRVSIDKIAARILASLGAAAEQEFIVLCGCASADERPDEDAVAFTMRRAQAAADELIAALGRRGCLVSPSPQSAQPTYGFTTPSGTEVVLSLFGLGVAHARDDARPPCAQRYVEIRAMDVTMPAEHGYRFFPSFYANLFDTMQRTPLLESVPQEPLRAAIRRQRHLNDPKNFGPAVAARKPSARTVFDNLRSVELHAFDNGDRMPLVPLERRNRSSVRALLDVLDVVQRQGKVPQQDLARGQLKVLQYLTSCAARRESYAGQTWWEFIGADAGSPEFQALLEHWPQALVGLRAHEADARTFGTVLVQLLLDQLHTDGYRDCTLNGPTTEAWLEPWREYLASELKVQFRRCSVDDLRLKFLEKRGWTVWAEASLRERERGEERPTVAERPEGEDLARHLKVNVGYLVLATPLEQTARLARSLRRSIDEANIDARVRDTILAEFDASPFAAALELVPSNDAHRTNAAGAGPFRHFAGIQFFLATDFAPLRGHVYYPSSRWCLSSISQAQFRRDRPDAADGYLGILSVVIGAWNERGNYNDKPAWQCGPAEIAAEVWMQITGSLADEGALAPPKPLFFAIDDGLRFGKEHVGLNETPFLINHADYAHLWPGRPGAYGVHFGRVVFAGTYMRTFTRLVTMEAANESARHAVNAILRDRREAPTRPPTGQDCAVFDPEQREPPDLWLYRRLDEELLARGLPHMFEILDADVQVAAWFGEPGVGPLAAVRRLAESSGEIGTELLRMIRERLLGRSM